MAMKSMKNGAIAHLPQEDATLLAFRRRRKKLIAFFSTFLIFLALIIAALITFLIIDGDSQTFDRTATVDPSLREFCSVVSTPSCLASFDPIIYTYTKPVTYPIQVLTLSLETAAEELRILIPLLSNSTHRSKLGGCSSSVREALSQINGTLSFVDPSQRYKMMDRIEAAKQELDRGCGVEHDDSGKANSTAAGEVEEKVERAILFLGYSRDFLFRYVGVWMVPGAARHSLDWRWLTRELEENLFVVVLCGLQLCFLGFLLCSVLRTRTRDSFDSDAVPGEQQRQGRGSRHRG